jgi:tRNA A-37 threonylcarbamoyl transferase component Bud32
MINSAVLQEALHSAASLCGVTTYRNERWSVGREIKRARAVLYPLFVTFESGPSIAAFYKVYSAPYSWTKEGLAHAQALDSTLAQACSREGITPARVLATAPEEFILVTHAVPGRALGPTYHQIVGKKRREHALHTYRKIGRAIGLIEDLGQPEAAMDLGQQWRSIAMDLKRLSAYLWGPEIKALRAQLKEMLDAAVASTSLVYCHGDLNQANIRLSRNGLGLIDFGWTINLQGHDLAYFVNKIEHEAVIVRPWTSALVSALLEGYGEPQFTSSPSWSFYRRRYLVRRASRPAKHLTKAAWIAERARRMLRAELAVQ